MKTEEQQYQLVADVISGALREASEYQPYDEESEIPETGCGWVQSAFPASVVEYQGKRAICVQTTKGWLEGTNVKETIGGKEVDRRIQGRLEKDDIGFYGGRIVGSEENGSVFYVQLDAIPFAKPQQDGKRTHAERDKIRRETNEAMGRDWNEIKYPDRVLAGMKREKERKKAKASMV